MSRLDGRGFTFKNSKYPHRVQNMCSGINKSRDKQINIFLFFLVVDIYIFLNGTKCEQFAIEMS